MWTAEFAKKKALDIIIETILSKNEAQDAAAGERKDLMKNKRPKLREALSATCVTFAIAVNAFAETSLVTRDLMGKVTVEIERINQLRERLVAGFQGEVTKDTFRSVCQPIGQNLQQFARDHKLSERQPAFKYRNEKHKPNTEETAALEAFKKDRALLAFWRETAAGFYYFRRIEVKSACLRCHGLKEERSDFVKSSYPRDKAYGFQAGDLRAGYSVFIADESRKRERD